MTRRSLKKESNNIANHKYFSKQAFLAIFSKDTCNANKPLNDFGRSRYVVNLCLAKLFIGQHVIHDFHVDPTYSGWSNKQYLLEGIW